MKVLVVEDDPDQLQLRCLLLQKSGFVVSAASDRASAVSSVVAENPQCAVVDLRLPREEDGLALIETLKHLHPSIHIVVLTGSDAKRLAAAPQATLIDRIFVKGGPIAGLLNYLAGIAAL